MYRLKKENATSTDGKVTVQADKDKFKINIDGKSTQATRILPEEYQQLEYIVSDGFQTIDTNYKPNNNTRIITKFQYASATTDNSQYNILFGILRPSISDVAYSIRQFDYGYTRVSYNTSRDITLDQSLNNSNLHVVDFNKNLLYLDGNLLKTFNEGVFQANTNLFIFNDRKNIESTGKTGGKMKMYYFIIYENNNIIRNFIPCYRKSDNTIGLYDVINNSFYTNSNTAFIKDFTKGDNIQIPSPEFPSEIKSLGDEGTVTIEQRGKNLIKFPYANNSKTMNGITYTVNDDGTILINGTATSLSYFILSNTVDYGGSFSGAGLGTNGNYAVPITNSNTAFMNYNNANKILSINVNSGVTINNLLFKPILIEGTSVTQDDYEPYFSKDYVIPLSAPLRSLPNGTKDTIEEDGIHRRVGSVVLDGSEDWRDYTKIGNNARAYYIYNGIKKQSKCLSNYFKYSSLFETDETGINLSPYKASLITIKIPLTKLETKDIQGIKNWLSTHNTEVLYELSEEVVEPFTDEQLEVINSMITEKGTNIFDINEDTRITINYTPEFTDEIKHAFRYGVTRGYLEVLDGSKLIINEDNYLQSIDFDDERYVDGEGIIGTTVAKSLEGKFVNVDSEFSVENKELQAYIGAELDDGTTKYIDLGTFIVQKPDNDNVKDNTSFTSLDYMVKFNQTYKDTITYPCTLGQLLQNVCDQVGIVLGTKTFRNSNFLVENNQFVNNESCREVLKAIAQMAFSWARINQDNELVLDFNLIDEPTAEFDYDEYYDLTSNEQYGPVNTIILKNSQVEGENYTVKNQDLIDEAGKEIALTISDNPFAYTQAKRSQLIQAGKELFGFKYIPFTTKTIGYIYLNCQDKIRIKNMQDKLLNSYLFNNKFSYEGSISDNKETSAMTETETKYQFTDTVEKKLNAKIARTEIIVDKANQEITEVVEKQTEYDKSLTEIKAGLGSVTSTVEEIKNFKRSKRSTNEIYITDAMEDGTLSFTAIGNESVNVVLFPLNNLYPSDDLYGGNEYNG